MTQTATASTYAIKVQEGKCWRQGQVSNQHQLARVAKRATSSSLEDRPDKARVWIVGGREGMLEGGWDRRRCKLWDHVRNAWSCGDDVAYRESLQCAVHSAIGGGMFSGNQAGGSIRSQCTQTRDRG